MKRLSCKDCGAVLGPKAVRNQAVRCHPCSIAWRVERRRLAGSTKRCRCGDLAFGKSDYCAVCRIANAKKAGVGKILWDGIPEHCPACAGLPWRRGEDRDGNVVASTCERCGLPREEEAPLQLLGFLVAQETAPMVESQTRFHGRAL